MPWKKKLHDSEEGDGSLLLEVLGVTLLKDKAFQPLSHLWMEIIHIQGICDHIKNKKIKSPTKCQHTLRNSISMPSCPGALPFAIPSIAFKNSRALKGLINSSFIALINNMDRLSKNYAIASSKGC